MNQPDNQSLTKVAVAKAQLVTALDLFIRDKDPISVQCLACGGGEVVEGLAEIDGTEPFATHILATQPQMDRKEIRRKKNLYWNAFKHCSDLKGMARDDEKLLADFNDTMNDAALFIGWWDYAVVQQKLPVAAQVFMVWWCALYEEKLAPDVERDAIRTAFTDIRRQARAEQKRRLRRTIEKYRNNKKLLADPATEL